jgi:D-alanine-D-alanine ligase
MTKTRIGVVRGGPCSEYEVSLMTGLQVLNALDREKFEPLDIIISKVGAWHMYGLETKPHDVFHRVDVIFNCLHGYYGEDGKIQSLLEAHSVPFTGSGSLSSAIAMNKILAKEYFHRADIKTPAHVLIYKEKIETEFKKGENVSANLFRIAHSKFSLPYIVKPVSGGSSIGVSLVKTRDDFAPALAKAFESGDSVMIEEFIPGTEASVGVIERFRDKDLYVLPPVEVRPVDRDIFDYKAKYEGGSNDIVPATFSFSIKKELERLALAAHEALGLRHYSRSDFIVSPHRGIYIIETNVLPGLTKESLLSKEIDAVGSSLTELTGHLINLALDN